MNTYLLVHRHPHNYTGSPEARAVWEAWFGKLGDALVDKGNSVLGGRSVSGEAGTGLPLGGYTLVRAGDLEEATGLANGCPILQEGGAVEVGMLTPAACASTPPAPSSTCDRGPVSLARKPGSSRLYSCTLSNAHVIC